MPIKNWEDYTEICEGKLEEFKSKERCRFCKEDYFKTKYNKCIYFKPERYIDPGFYINIHYMNMEIKLIILNENIVKRKIIF